MGWMFCGEDSNGRSIGYGIEATCDHPACNERIDHGLEYVCGGMHGEDEYSCEKYFCDKHKTNTVLTHSDDIVTVCDSCKDVLLATKEWADNAMEGYLEYMNDEGVKSGHYVENENGYYEVNLDD